MSKDLGITSAQLSNCVAFFYIGFVLFQLPGSLFVRLITPPIQMGGALVVWGVLTAV